MQFHSIRARMTLGVSLAIGALLLGSSWALIWNARRTAEQNAGRLLGVAARKVAREASKDAARFDISELMADERDFASENLTMIIVDRQGHLLQKSQNAIPTWPRKGNDGWHVTTVPIGENLAVVGFHWRRVEQALQEQSVLLESLSLIVFLAGSVGAWWLVGRTLSPIGRLSQQAQTASVENLHVHLHTPSNDAEMVQLVHTLNGLLARLAQSAAARERFYAAASHELRNPLQALIGHLGLALRRPRENHEYETVIQEAQEQTRCLASLVENLLLLNQLEVAPAPPPALVDLVHLCEQILADYRPQILERRLRVQCDFPTEVMLSAPPAHTSMLVRNVIENALKYTPVGGQVCLRIPPDEMRLLILNAFESTYPWEQDKLFEPFYRPDASRSSDTGGNGLGLAICKAITDTNGWTIRLERKAKQVECTIVFRK